MQNTQNMHSCFKNAALCYTNHCLENRYRYRCRVRQICSTYLHVPEGSTWAAVAAITRDLRNELHKVSLQLLPRFFILGER